MIAPVMLLRGGRSALFKPIKATFLGNVTSFTVRRGCGKCIPCSMNHPDMCRTGDYRERGIWGADGYKTEFAVDKEQYVGRDQRTQTGVNRAVAREDVHHANDPK
jgi:hypothetical protein